MRFRRSLYAVEDIEVGEKFTVKNTRTIRPGFGLPPKFLNKVIGKSALVSIKRGDPINWSLVDNDSK